VLLEVEVKGGQQQLVGASARMDRAAHTVAPLPGLTALELVTDRETKASRGFAFAEVGRGGCREQRVAGRRAPRLLSWCQFRGSTQ
jgi:hypothetical protein